MKTAKALAAQQGRAISEAVATEVEQTLRAALPTPGQRPPYKAAACFGRFPLTASTSSISPARGRPRQSSGQGNTRWNRKGTADGGPADVRRAEPADRAPSEAASRKPPAEQPRLRAVGKARTTPTPPAVERARAAMRRQKNLPRPPMRRQAGRRRTWRRRRPTPPGWPMRLRELRRRLDQAEAELKGARKRHELAAALAQQTARAADRQRRKAVLARERVLRLGNTPEA